MSKAPTQPPFDPTHPFTRAEARAHGISRVDLRGPTYQRLFFDLYIASSVRVTALVRARAALKISPAGSHASHFTAAEIWTGVVPTQHLTHVTVPPGASRTERRGIKGHDGNPRATVVVHRGIRVSAPTQCFLDLAGRLSLVDLVVLGDSMVKAERCTPQQLVEAADGWTGHGARLARRAARLVRSGVDSPMESRLRMLIVLAGLPEPKPNIILYNHRGEWLVRFDLCYPALKLVVEYDGRQHAEDDEQWGRDIDRREHLDRWGYRLVVVRSKGIYVEPERTLRRVVSALRERGARDLPRRLNEEWRQHFPGRGY